MPQLLSGKEVAEEIYRKILLDLSLLSFVPKLVVILLGADPASQTYVKSKRKKCLDLGMRGETLELPPSTSEAELVDLIQKLNRDNDVTGILVQLPLPPHINRRRVLDEIDPVKDVDGLHPENAGRLFLGAPRFQPCTPSGVMEILRYGQIAIAGMQAVVIGRSEIVGRPMAQLLMMHDATVTICHSKTRNLEREAARADILVAALGRPKAIGPAFVKDGAVVIDVGIHRTADGLCGDVDFAAVSSKCRAITPVPGGVGPMTIAMLMKNLILAASLQSKAR